MSLYNSIFGTNNLAPVLLKILGIDQGNGEYTSGRFRDIYLNEDGTKIILYTRNGGGNREHYQYVFDSLSKHPNYITNYDDGFDCTYAYLDFSVPDEYKEDLQKLASEHGQSQNPSEKFQQLLSDLEVGKNTPETEKAMKAGEQILGEIKESLDSGENKIITI